MQAAAMPGKISLRFFLVFLLQQLAHDGKIALKSYMGGFFPYDAIQTCTPHCLLQQLLRGRSFHVDHTKNNDRRIRGFLTDLAAADLIDQKMIALPHDLSLGELSPENFYEKLPLQCVAFSAIKRNLIAQERQKEFKDFLNWFRRANQWHRTIDPLLKDHAFLFSEEIELRNQDREISYWNIDFRKSLDRLAALSAQDLFCRLRNEEYFAHLNEVVEQNKRSESLRIKEYMREKYKDLHNLPLDKPAKFTKKLKFLAAQHDIELLGKFADYTGKTGPYSEEKDRENLFRIAIALELNPWAHLLPFMTDDWGLLPQLARPA